MVSILLIASMIAVALTLVIGLFSMAKGGAFNEKYGNKLMKARVVLQGVALALIAIVIIQSRG